MKIEMIGKTKEKRNKQKNKSRKAYIIINNKMIKAYRSHKPKLKKTQMIIIVKTIQKINKKKSANYLVQEHYL